MHRHLPTVWSEVQGLEPFVERTAAASSAAIAACSPCTSRSPLAGTAQPANLLIMDHSPASGSAELGLGWDEGIEESVHCPLLRKLHVWIADKVLAVGEQEFIKPLMFAIAAKVAASHATSIVARTRRPHPAEAVASAS